MGFLSDLTGEAVTVPVYAFNSSTTATSEAASFAYGETGAPVYSFAPTGTVNVIKRVKCPFTNPRFAMLQFSNGFGWVDVAATIAGFKTDETNSVYYGSALSALNSTEYEVSFYSKATPGIAWSVLSAWRWRVVFANTPMAVPLTPASATASGVVSAEYTKIRTGTSVNGATTTPSIAVIQSRVGNQVILTIPSSGSLVKNASAGTLTLNIDSEFWPSTVRYNVTYGEVATASVSVLWAISAAGVVSMHKTVGGNTFGAGETGIGWTLPVTLTYTVS